MAELILTEEERKSTWADADEVALGKATKYVAYQLGMAKDTESPAPSVMIAAASVLINLAVMSNANKMEQKITNAMRKGVAIGDWELSVRKIESPRKYGITVNGDFHMVTKKNITYDEVLMLAYGILQVPNKMIRTVSYCLPHNPVPYEGTLTAGQSVALVTGLSFDVCDTSGA